MALWQLPVVAFGMSESSEHSDNETGTRLAALGRAVVYAVIAWSVLKFAAGQGTQSSDKESVDLTATLLKYPFGQVLVVIIGLALVGGGVYIAYAAWKEKFRKGLDLGQAGRLRRVVEWPGKFGGIARGAVFVTAGIFIMFGLFSVLPGQVAAAMTAHGLYWEA
jgi:chromate transport protein ChrA